MNCTIMHGSTNVKETSDLKNESVTSLLLTPYATIIGLTTLKGFIAATKIKVSLMKNCCIHWNVYPHSTININDRQCKYCVTLMRVRETIVAVKKTVIIIYSEIVFVVLGIQHAKSITP